MRLFCFHNNIIWPISSLMSAYYFVTYQLYFRKLIREYLPVCIMHHWHDQALFWPPFDQPVRFCIELYVNYRLRCRIKKIQILKMQLDIPTAVFCDNLFACFTRSLGVSQKGFPKSLDYDWQVASHKFMLVKIKFRFCNWPDQYLHCIKNIFPNIFEC